MMGQLPPEQVTADMVFSTVGVDYAGPIPIKRGSTHRPSIIKAYVAVFVSLTVKAVHLEAVSDLTARHFLPACGDLYHVVANLHSFGVIMVAMILSVQIASYLSYFLSSVI